MRSGAKQLGSDFNKDSFKEKVKAWLKTTPAIILSVSAAATVFWSIFAYAVKVTPLGEQVIALASDYSKHEQNINELNETVKKNGEADIVRHNEIMAEIYIVQLMGMINRSMGNPHAKERILVIHEKLKNLNRTNEYIEYELGLYLESIKDK